MQVSTGALEKTKWND